MKKIIALSLVIILIFGTLSGCGSSLPDNGENKPANTESQEQSENTEKTDSQSPSQILPSPPANIGDVLDVPEAVPNFTTDQAYVYYGCFDERGNAMGVEMALKGLDEDTYIMYVAIDAGIREECIYEVTTSGMRKYYKVPYKMDAFAEVTDLSQSELGKEHNAYLEDLIRIISGCKAYTGVQYRKEEEDIPLDTGAAYIYDVLEDGEKINQVYVDKQTGLFVRINDENDQLISVIRDFKFADVEIPEYK